MKAEVKYIEDQWGKLASEIKTNILPHYQVICPYADFSEVRLDKHVVDGRIKVTPDDDEEGDLEDSEPEPANLATDL